jgi:hypothetical protein
VAARLCIDGWLFHSSTMAAQLCGRCHPWFLLWCRLMVEFLVVLVCALFLLALVYLVALNIVIVVSGFS